MLARGAAVLLIGGLAAGCSSDVMRFEESILTGSARPGQQVASAQQAYPGDTAQVDRTYTGSVASSGRGGGILNRAGINPRPQGDVQAGGTMMAGAVGQNTYPQQQVYAAAPQPGYTPPVTSQGVTSSTLPPVVASNQLPAPSAPQARAARVESAQPLPTGQTNVAGGTLGTLPANNMPTPGQAPVERVAVLPQQPKLKEQQGTPAASTGTQTANASGGGGYTVVSGDTLNGIARKTGVSAAAIRQANGLDSGLIRIGQTLTIPAGGNGAVQVAAQPKPDATTTAAVAAAKPPATEPNAYTPPQKAEKVIQQASLDTSSAPDASGIGKMRWPVRGRVISGYGGSSGSGRNDGIDIAVPSGTPIKAAENGVVIYAGDGLKEFGNTVLVRHENGLVTVYGHASEINVQRGQKVRRGEDIAKAGMSGSADTPKLHFEVRKDSTPVDPTTFLE
ncbi:peptidoglycan DD-metalloendopeptidase family protein [Mesorhizobium sp. CAU 1732]|uniref:peptidoglycan DD-metalloendopeptidase family protein n=1 Tax=Mesorhizobium sp. CAU 1732 TaxID=3140358 RepID=UPI0032606C69